MKPVDRVLVAFDERTQVVTLTRQFVDHRVSRRQPAEQLTNSHVGSASSDDDALPCPVARIRSASSDQIRGQPHPRTNA